MRFSSGIASELLVRCFQATQNGPGIAPSWNIRSGGRARVVLGGTSACPRRLDVLTWGLIPGFVKSARRRSRLATISADCVATSRSTKSAFASRRCLIPAMAFYELSDRPRAVESAERSVLAFAGVWDTWPHPVTGELLKTFAMITETADPPSSSDTADDAAGAATPLLVRPEHWADWLGETGADVRGLLRASPREAWRRWNISRKFLNSDEDSPDLLAQFCSAADSRCCLTGQESAGAPQAIRPCC